MGRYRLVLGRQPKAFYHNPPHIGKSWQSVAIGIELFVWLFQLADRWENDLKGPTEPGTTCFAVYTSENAPEARFVAAIEVRTDKTLFCHWLEVQGGADHN